MKMHHFALFFAIIAFSFFVVAQSTLVIKMQEENKRKTEYDCLVAAVNAVVDVAFSGTENSVTTEGLYQAEEVFFQTFAVLVDGSTDKATRDAWKKYIPCLVVFGKDGYYRYRFIPGDGYGWSELILYENGKITEKFFEETEELLQQYHSLHYDSEKKYQMAQAGKGIWEQSIRPPCVLAIYAPKASALIDDKRGFLYAASGLEETIYFVTEDNYCHMSFCEKCKNGKIVARYSSQKKSAEEGAVPCEYCMK